MTSLDPRLEALTEALAATSVVNPALHLMDSANLKRAADMLAFLLREGWNLVGVDVVIEDEGDE